VVIDVEGLAVAINERADRGLHDQPFAFRLFVFLAAFEEEGDRSDEIGGRVEGFCGAGAEGGEDEEPDQWIMRVEGDLGHIGNLGELSRDGLDCLRLFGIHRRCLRGWLMNPVKYLGDPGRQAVRKNLPDGCGNCCREVWGVKKVADSRNFPGNFLFFWG
jgi:hypothetical protein